MRSLSRFNFQVTVTITGFAETIIAIPIPLVWMPVKVVFTANIVYTDIAADHANSDLTCRCPLALRRDP